VNTTVVACCQLTPVLGDVHADRRPELYRRIAEQAIPQQTTTQMPLPS
jgi:hypothetical protein